MNKKLILKYIFICSPFLIGTILFTLGIFNIFSSVLLFLGGYIAIKNIFDYRKVRKNINSVNRVEKRIDYPKTNHIFKNDNQHIELTKKRKISLIRKRIK